MSGELQQREAGEVLAGKFRIVRLLGLGGMGAVYEVEHEITRHRRALKLLHPEFAQNEQVVARFLREASAAGRIGSPHIVETFDAGLLETGEPYLVMEMLSGTSLADAIEERGGLPEERVADILVQACVGIQAAHDAGIIHRDIKPENLFITSGGAVKILDFGISKFDPALTGDMQLTGDGTAMGTPFYMPPEQTHGASQVDGRADVYALGVVLYEALTGRKPFFANTFPELVVKIYEGSYAPASSYLASPTVFDAVIAKAMSRNPEHRYGSPSALGEAIAAVRTGALTSIAGTREESMDRTVIAVEGVPSPEALASVASATPTGQVRPLRLEPTLMSPEAQPAPPRALPKLLGGGALVAVMLGGALWLARAPDEPNGEKESGLPSPTPIEARPSSPSAAEPASSSAGSAVSSAVPASETSAPPANSDAPKNAPPASNPAATKPKTRAGQHGLDEQNPF